MHTNDVFSQFRMIVRFLCGLLSDESMNVFYLLYKHMTPRRVPISQLPECVQLRFQSSDLFQYTGWTEFIETSVSAVSMSASRPFMITLP